MPDLSHEKKHGCDDGKIICGVDEVGRGPLAGPVIAAAAIIPHDFPCALANSIQDSKKLSAAAREALFPSLTSLCIHAVAEASVEEISTMNILWASMLAMQRAVAGLRVAADIALIDGNRAPQLECRAITIVKGDSISLSIAAASIIAKVARDRVMRQLADDYPGYGWERNAGYGTAEHLDALRRLGPTPWHRDGFGPVMRARTAFSS